MQPSFFISSGLAGSRGQFALQSKQIFFHGGHALIHSGSSITESLIIYVGSELRHKQIEHPQAARSPSSSPRSSWKYDWIVRMASSCCSLVSFSVFKWESLPIFCFTIMLHDSCEPVKMVLAYLAYRQSGLWCRSLLNSSLVKGIFR